MLVKDLLEILKGFNENAEVNIGIEGNVVSDFMVDATCNATVLIRDYDYYDESDSIEAQQIIKEEFEECFITEKGTRKQECIRCPFKEKCGKYEGGWNND